MRGSALLLRKMMLLAAVMLLISSCATLSRNGVGRVKEYTIASDRLPLAFDGCRVAFISDIHYPSLFAEKRLGRLVACLNELEPDILLLGGDYVTCNDSIDALFDAIASVAPAMGTYAVLGNHERNNEAAIRRSMKEHGIVLLADSGALICNDDATIYVAGVYESFAHDSLRWQPLGNSTQDTFVVLLAHTPDYAEATSVKADLVLSGHTHGGQVSLFGLYMPVKNTDYGKRFLHGLNKTTNAVMVITTNGVGTSRKKVRFCVPSEVVVITLRHHWE